MQKLMLSPDVNVTWNKGKVTINNGNGGEPYITDEPAILMLLDNFLDGPKAPAAVLEKVKAQLSDELAANLEKQMDTLKSNKILTPYYLTHQEFFKILNEKRKDMDFLKYDDWGMTVSNCGKENLSPGCQSCKDGRWICVFPSFTCNAQCKFCPRLTEEMIEKPPMGEVAQDLLLMTIDSHKDDITGFSISGGEIFFKNYDRAKELVKQVKTRFPHMYLWAYTNGIAASEDNMKELRDLGLNELRFNLAATDFDLRIIDKVKNHAIDIFPWVTVEVPIYDESFEHLINREKLKELADMGVKQLNLAEIRVPSPDSTEEKDISPAARHFLDSEELYQYEYMFLNVLTVVKSRLFTYDIFDYVNKNNIDIRVNDCSQDAKFVQISKRTARGLDKISKDVDAFSDY